MVESQLKPKYEVTRIKNESCLTFSERELGGMKSVNAMKATTKNSFENFQRKLPYKVCKILVLYLFPLM